MPRLTGLVSAAVLAATVALPSVAGAQSLSPDAQARILDRNGETTGTAALTQGPHGLLITVEMVGLPPGWHAFHIHQVGDCSDPEEGFRASGSHLGLGEAGQGLMSPDGPYAGDLPNIHADEQGRVRVQLFTTFASLTGAKGPGMTVLDEDGAALVMQETPDDHLTGPAGDGRNRLVCGVITQ